jgi:hypothetical protein
MTENFKIDGLKEFFDALNDLALKRKAELYRALNKKAVQKYVVNNIRSTINYSQSTEKGITTVNDRSDKTAVYGGVTSAVFWLRFADRGTASRQTEKGAFRGAISSKNQIQPVIEGSNDGIIGYMNDEIGDEIIKILSRKLKYTDKKLGK